MANKKIWELPSWIPSGNTSNNTIPIDNNFFTQKISLSAITEYVQNNITTTVFTTNYNELRSMITGSSLNAGSYYLMTDYQTCYDQPNYDNTKNPITTGNYKTETTEPILLLAISTTGFSPTVYSTLYPQDKITYDITWNTTEITSSPAKGRITERIDNFNNRTDYDHRSILFKRYRGYSYDENNPLAGLIGINGITGTTGILYGNTGTTFNSNISSGSIIVIPNLNPVFFEVISVASNSLAIISGVTISGTDSAPYYSASDDGIMSYYQPNINQNEVYEYTTFGDAIDDGGAVNNYIGNYSNLHLEFGTGDFLLANNVLLEGSFRNNTIGNGSYNNTFNDDCDNNQIGDSFYNNSTNDDFDGNIIGENFRDNYITSNFNNNRIGSDFYSNTLLGGSFYRNNIGNNFNNNVWTNNDFQNNEIGNQFNYNKIYNDFYNNDIGNGYNNNESYSQYFRNLIGNGYNGNTVYSVFYENSIEHVFYNNTIGTDLTIGTYIFRGNRIGSYFENNNCYGSFAYNTIGTNFNYNEVQDGFGFGGSSSQGNRIGNYFENNTIGEYFYNNTISDNFQSNEVGDSFQWNIVNTEVNNIDFTTNYGNISGITYTSTGSTATDSSYGNVGGTTNGIGVNALFQIDVVSGSVINVSVNNSGNLYVIGDTITILGSQIGGTDGVDNVIITVSSVSQTPSVYELYTCDIFKNSVLSNRLSYYDGSDVLTIKNINE
jgi:hypothetical protein